MCRGSSWRRRMAGRRRRRASPLPICVVRRCDCCSGFCARHRRWSTIRRSTCLPARSSLAARPLTDDEIALGRSFSSETLGETRQPAAWALAEATVRTSELSAIRIRDVDLDDAPRLDRWEHEDGAPLGSAHDWGVEPLARRIAILDADPDAPLVYDGTGARRADRRRCARRSPRPCGAPASRDEPDVRPVSVAAWAGARIFERDGPDRGGAHARSACAAWIAPRG